MIVHILSHHASKSVKSAYLQASVQKILK